MPGKMARSRASREVGRRGEAVGEFIGVEAAGVSNFKEFGVPFRRVCRELDAMRVKIMCFFARSDGKDHM